MKLLKLVVLSGALIAFGSGLVLADCNNSGYGSTKCENNKKDFDLEKKVSKSNSESKEEKITGVKKGDNFIFTFKIKNNTDEEVTIKLVDN